MLSTEASDGSERNRVQLALIGRLHHVFAANAVEYWLFGGWAVDFRVGRTTRPHDDIDIAIWKSDFDLVDQLLHQEGWSRHPQAGEDGYTVYKSGATALDLAFLARTADGTVHTPLEDGRGDWHEGAFTEDLLQLGGFRARVVSVASLLADKTERRDDPTADSKDRADVLVLGLEPPSS